MTASKDQIWKLLERAELIPAEDQAVILERFQAQLGEPEAEEGDAGKPDWEPTDEQWLDWLLDQGYLTPLQRRVIGDGCSGPFRFANYLITARISDPYAVVDRPTVASYTGRYASIGHPVRLLFLPGEGPAGIQNWLGLLRWLTRRQRLEIDNLADIYEAVATPTHRFVVAEVPLGQPMLTLIPPKSRLTWDKSCTAAACIAHALAELHSQQIVHERVWPGNVQILSDGSAQLQWDLTDACQRAGFPVVQNRADLPPITETADLYQSDNALDDQADWYGLGCLLYRLMSGRPPGWQASERARLERIDKLANLKVPHKAVQMVKYLTTTAGERTKTGERVLELFGQLLDRNRFKIGNKFRPASHAALLRELKRKEAPETLPQLGKPAVASIPEISLPEHRATGNKPNAPPAKPRKRKSALFTTWVGVSSGVATCVLVTLLLYLLGAQIPVRVSSSPPQPESGTEKPDETEPTAESGRESPTSRALNLNPQGTLVQAITEDDGQLLWESPTHAIPIDLADLPPAADFIFVVRPADFLKEEQAAYFLRSLGPDFQRAVDEWQQSVGIKLKQIRQLVISLHHDGSPEYRPVFTIVPVDPLGLEQQQTIWQVTSAPSEATEKSPLPDSVGLFQREGDSIVVRLDDASKVTRFAVGNTALMEKVVQEANAPLSGPLGRIARQADGARHFNLFFMPRILSNEQSQNLFSGKLAPLHLPLQYFFEERINAALFSFHLQEDFYWELQFDTSPDLDARELRELLENALQQQRDDITRYLVNLPANEYWDDLRIRTAGMLQFMYRYTRIGTERGVTKVNGWLPGIAAPNLLAASELALALGGASTNPPVTPATNVPQSLTELLARKRNLTVTNSPDLINLLQDLQTEIREDFPGLPFAFKIELAGNELAKQGITQNQRPGEIIKPDHSLAEILTEICFKANPDKNATAPSDPLCELLWAVGPDPDQPDQRIIIVTTRTAAENDPSLDIAPAFLKE